MKKTITIFLFSLLVFLFISACDVISGLDEDTGSIQGSGHIEARTVSVSPEIGGRVVEVFAAESDIVQKGDILIRFDDDIYQAQYNQAVTAVGSAEVAIETSRAQLEAALVNYQMAVQGARFREQPIRNASWQIPQPNQFTLPVWYFEKDEKMIAADADINLAQ